MNSNNYDRELEKPNQESDDKEVVEDLLKNLIIKTNEVRQTLKIMSTTQSKA